jgi:hypothetical protein
MDPRIDGILVCIVLGDIEADSWRFDAEGLQQSQIGVDDV